MFIDNISSMAVPNIILIICFSGLNLPSKKSGVKKDCSLLRASERISLQANTPLVPQVLKCIYFLMTCLFKILLVDFRAFTFGLVLLQVDMTCP